MHHLVVVLHVEVFSLLQQSLHTLFRKELDESLVLRQRLVSLQQLETTIFLVAFGDKFLGIVENLVEQVLLCGNKLLNLRLQVIEKLVVALWCRTRNNQRRTCIIDKYRVNFVNNRIVVLALNQIGWRKCHVVTQIVETELVVCSESNIRSVSLTTCIAVRFVLVDAINRKSVEHIQRPHPLGVTFCKVVVHGYNMHSPTRQCVEEYRQGCHEGFTFTGCHFGDFSLMQNYTADELHIVVNHIPRNSVTTGNPRIFPYSLIVVDSYKVVGCGKVAVEIGSSHHHLGIFLETAGCFLQYCKRLRENCEQVLLDFLVDFFLYLVNLVEHLFAFPDVEVLCLFLQFGNLIFLVLDMFVNTFAKFLSACAKLVVRQSQEFIFQSKHFV